MNVELNNYNIDECIGILLNKYITEHPQYYYTDLTKEFGISERTLYRWLKKYLIAPKQRKFEDRAVGYLIAKGYKIEKDDPNN